MAFEKKWARVLPTSLSGDGKDNGEVPIADACKFKVGQIVVLSSATQPDLRVKIKRIPTPTLLVVGPDSQTKKNEVNINTRIDVSAYKVADAATVRAEEQSKTRIPEKDITQATYEREPTLAWRTFNVDKCGNPYSKENPFPVDASINVDS